jgi:hypothetical protein
MATFNFLSPADVPVTAVGCLGRCNKGPNVRILNSKNEVLEAGAVRGVDKIVDLLESHLMLEINVTSSEVLRLNYEGNIHLSNGQLEEAIDCYNTALSLREEGQEGILRLMRGSALLQRAYSARMRYRDMVKLSSRVLPSVDSIRQTLESLQVMSQVANAGSPELYYTTVHTTMLRVHALFESDDGLNMNPRWTELRSKVSRAECLMPNAYVYSLQTYTQPAHILNNSALLSTPPSTLHSPLSTLRH